MKEIKDYEIIFFIIEILIFIGIITLIIYIGDKAINLLT